MSNIRIAVAGFMHESNTFLPGATRLQDFTVLRGPQILERYLTAQHEISGFLAGAGEYDFELCPLFVASALPSAPVAREAYATLLDELLAALRAAQPIDGVLLALHGAMVAEDYPDADGEIVRQVRALVGPGFPVVVTHDHHANISPLRVRESTALVVYKTNPHVDQRERGLQAARIVAGTARGELRPVQALYQPAMFLNIIHQNTTRPPMLPLLQAAAALEQSLAVLAANIAAGYQYADVYDMGPAAVVVTDGDATLAQTLSARLGKMLLDIKPGLAFALPDAVEAVRRAQASEARPVVLVDVGDNIGAGSPGDSTFILQQLMEQNAEGWVVVIADAEAAAACAGAGVGSTVDLWVGAKTDDRHGAPVRVTGRVVILHEGKYEERAARHGGQRFFDQGLTSVVEVAGSPSPDRRFLVLTSHREAPYSLEQLLSLGIRPQWQRILVVKAAIAYRAAYEPITGAIIEVDTPGVTSVNPRHFTYRRVRRPLWGLTYPTDLPTSGATDVYE